eukprot:CAMPEP_0116087090 /NCGR_PEP_ID=MMETSP0327-20121206/5188_1 /TAXON_ID=44447 /ORGANISM="Pseudo-nitzschia delicatissima, Strain B596" /LENGTH=931 /DNA_ID=CAMNT_0003578155 /DNA_START=1924 /DNA_END=4719 /DNA_ORIENTATION=-
MASDGIGFFDDDDDDDMLDMFSFGVEGAAPVDSTDPPTSSDVPYKPPDAVKEAVKTFGSAGDKTDDDNSDASNDSFLDLLESAHHNDLLVLGTMDINEGKPVKKEDAKSEDSDMQDFLDWLDDDDKKGSELYQRQEEELSFLEPPRPPPLKDSLLKASDSIPEPVAPAETFKTLEEAAMSPESTKSDIRKLLEQEKFVVTADIRPHLWSKIICDKTLEETLQSSLADSIQKWEQEYYKTSKAEPETESKEEKSKQLEWLETQSDYLAERIVTVVDHGDVRFYSNALQAILKNHFNTGSNSEDKDDESWKDPLIPPVLCAILSSGAPPPAACVMLSQIIPTFMPILALETKERQETAVILHRQFYLLACYHLPLLVLHLDKYILKWHKCCPNGKIPQSWLISHLAGETDGAFMEAKCLLHLWDYVLTTENNSLRFFLLIAILDRHAERLLLLTGEDLQKEFDRVLSFSAEAHVSKNNPMEWIREWTDRATLLRDETPTAVTQKLKVLEDEAVTNSLIAKQEAKVEKLRIQQEAEEKAMEKAREAEKERKADEARARLNRARLVAFYRQFNPGKENNIDKIMVSYEGRFEVLDAKLRLKYGVGFNPALKPKPIPIALNNNNKKIFSTMNSGFSNFKAKNNNNNNNKKQQSLQPEKKENPVVEVPASEVLPVVCWSKDANKVKLKKKDSVTANSGKFPLKFYVVDCRQESTTREHGRLPTSLTFDPENTKSKDQEIFESLRGSAHICIMSEGYSALPQLYGDKMKHQMTSGLVEAIRVEDERRRVCANFFLSKGFPFVSVLDGGFASAHSYLCREGHKHHLNVNDVLIDYNPEVSLFGRFEKLHSMSRSEKAQRGLQNLFDSSMTALTKHGARLESSMNNSNTEGSMPTDGIPKKEQHSSPNRKHFSFGGLGIGKRHQRKQSTDKSMGPVVSKV